MPKFSELKGVDLQRATTFSQLAGAKLYTPISDVGNDSILDSLPDFVKAGYNESITGLTHQILSGEKPFDLENYNPSTLEDIGASVVSFFMPADVLTFMGGGGMGGFAAKKAGVTALKVLVKAGIKKNTAKHMVAKGIVGASALGTYSGLATGVRQQAEETGFNLGEILKSTAKGGVLGLTTGAVGGRGVAKGSSEAVKLVQEIGTFGTVSPITEGKLPTPDDYVHAAGVLLGMRGATGTGKLIKRAIKGEALIQPNLIEKPISKESLNVIAEAKAKEIEGGKRETEIWRSEKQQVKIEGESVDKTGAPVFEILDLDTNKKSTVNKENFFKDFELSSKNLSRKKIRGYRLSTIHQMQNKLGLSSNKIQELKRQIDPNADPAKEISSGDFTPRQLFKYKKLLKHEQQIREIKEIYKGATEFQPGKTLLEKIFPERLIKPLMAAENQIKSEQGRVLASQIRQSDARTKEIFGNFHEEMVFETGLHKMTKPQRERIADALEGKITVTGKEAQTIETIRKALTKYYKLSAKMGVKVADFRADYFPRMWKKNIAEIIYNDLMSIAERNKELLNELKDPKDVARLSKFIEDSVSTEFSPQTRVAMRHLKAQGLSYAEAFKALQGDIHREMYSPFGNLEKSRKLELPKEFYERDAGEVLVRYAMKLSRRTAFVEQWGNRGEVATALIKATAKKSTEEARTLSHVFSSYTGLIELDPAKNFSPRAKKLAHNLMSAEMATKIALGFATVPNLTQFTISTAMEAGYWRFFKGAFQLTNKDVRKRIRKSGATHYNVLDILLGTDLRLDSPKKIGESIKTIISDSGNRMQNVSSLLAKVSGFKGINAVNQMLAASTAQIFVKDLQRIYKTSPLKLRRMWAKRKLSGLGIKDASAKLTESQIEHAMYRFAKESQLQKDILKEPLFFNDPRIRPLMIFKRFGYRQAKYIKDTMKTEITRGNIIAPLRLALGGFAGAQFVVWAKDKMMKFMSGEDVYREDKEGFDKMIDAMGDVGAIGIFSDVVAAENKLQAIKFFVNPVFLSDLEHGFNGLKQFTYNVETFGFGGDALRRSIRGVAPIAGGFAKQVAKRAETKGQKAKIISTKKGRVRAKILDMLLEDKHKLAINSAKAWNKAYPSNPITGEDIAFKEIYERALRKQRIASNP